MQIPNKCPICNDNLLNEFFVNIDREQLSKKSCSKRLSHKFHCFNYVDLKEVSSIYLSYDEVLIQWFPHTKEMWAGKGRIEKLETWVEPNFSNIDKLINKVKICITFS